jgi:hypothetical protein
MPRGKFHQDQSGSKIAMLTLLEKTDARGLLCDPCNRALGLLKDNPDLMLKAISYLAR